MSIVIIPDLAQAKAAAVDSEDISQQSSDLDFEVANTQVLANESYNLIHKDYPERFSFTSAYQRIALEGDEDEKGFLKAIGEKIAALWRYLKETFTKFLAWLGFRKAKEAQLEQQLEKFFGQELIPGLEKMGSELQAALVENLDSLKGLESNTAANEALQKFADSVFEGAQIPKTEDSDANKTIALLREHIKRESDVAQAFVDAGILGEDAAAKLRTIEKTPAIAPTDVKAKLVEHRQHRNVGAELDHLAKATRVATAYEMAKRKLVFTLTAATKNQLIFNIAFSNNSKSLGILDDFVKSLGLELSPLSSDILAGMRKKLDYAKLDQLVNEFFSKYDQLKDGKENLSAKAAALIAELKSGQAPHLSSRDIPLAMKVFQLSTELAHSIKYVLSNFESDLQVSDSLAVLRSTTNAVEQGSENNVKIGQRITKYQGQVVQVLTALRTVAVDCTIPTSVAHDLLVFKAHYEKLVEIYKVYQQAQTSGEVAAKEYLEGILPEFSKL